jgi:hypothetical protein
MDAGLAAILRDAAKKEAAPQDEVGDNYVMVDVPIPTLKIWNQDIATS